MPRIALIHALSHSVTPINEAFARGWPEAECMNLLDDSLSADLARSAHGLDAAMYERFRVLGDYAVGCGAAAILFTCSAFGPCIDAVARRHSALPVRKPNEAMLDEARLSGGRVGLVASFAPTLLSMPAEFPPDARPDTELAAGALEALNRGELDAHDHATVAAALRLRARGCTVIALVQFSLARAAGAVRKGTGLPVLTTPDSAVAGLRRCLR